MLGVRHAEGYQQQAAVREQLPMMTNFPVVSQMFGSSGHLTRPRNSTVRAYTACLPADAEENRHVKTIANLRYVLRPIDPHHFSYQVQPSTQCMC